LVCNIPFQHKYGYIRDEFLFQFITRYNCDVYFCISVYYASSLVNKDEYIYFFYLAALIIILSFTYLLTYTLLKIYQPLSVSSCDETAGGSPSRKLTIVQPIVVTSSAQNSSLYQLLHFAVVLTVYCW